ncbi:MAG: PKD domain-containing protein [Candidatus Bipolaricaulia bacterium]
MAVGRSVLLGLLLLALAASLGLGGSLTGTGTGGEVAERAVVINEVAWAGTAANSNNEWLELYNNTDQEIDLTGWRLKSDDGSPDLVLRGIIPARGFFLLERGDDTTISDLPADQIYQGALTNSGESLRLFDPQGRLIDSANGDGGRWPGGTDANGKPPYASMERIDPSLPDADANWGTNNGQIRNGLDARGNPVNGTPKATNSAFNLPPVASFTFSPQAPLVNEEVVFDASASSDPDGKIVSFHWDFGDEAVSEGQTTSHKYERAGRFVVQLTVTDDKGSQGSTAKELIVHEENRPPKAAFSFTPERPTVEDPVQFIDESTDPDGEIVAWAWAFGDGATSALRNPSHQYAEPGSYTVTLTVTDDDGADATATAELIVAPKNLPPVADFNYSPLEPTTQDEVQFIDQSSDPDGEIVSWLWDFGDGATAEVQSPSHKYAKAGTYKVKLTVADDRGATDEAIEEITVGNVGPIAAFSITPAEALTGEPVTFDASASSDPDGKIVRFAWDFDGDGRFEECVATAKITHAFADNGSYTVRLEVTDDDGATDEASGTVKIKNRPPEAAFSFEPERPRTIDSVQFTDESSDRDGRIIAWAWAFGDGAGSSEQNPTHRYAKSERYTVILTVTDDDGDKASISKEIEVFNSLPFADFSFSPAEPKVGDKIQFVDLSQDPDGYIVFWGWDFGDGLTCPPECGSGNHRNPTHYYDAPATYTVVLTVIDNEGALVRTAKEITVGP